MELNALDCVFLVAHAHDDTLSTVRAARDPGRDFERVRQGGVCTGEGVIASDGDVLRNTGVDTLAVVGDWRRLAVQNLTRLCDGAAKDREDALSVELKSTCQRWIISEGSQADILAHADTENWNLATKVLDCVLAYTRV